MKKILCLLFAAFFICLPLKAAEEETLPGIKAPSAALMDINGEALFEKNAHEKRSIASVTKVMTLLLVFEEIDGGALSLSDTVTASAHACSMGGSQIWLEEGETLSVEDMVKAVVICSANDCAVALAEKVSGTEDAFVARMNERAKELSMNDTHFVNACGLDAEGHVSSAHDVAVMSCELIKHEKVKEYATIWQDTLRGGEFTMTNTNKLLRSYRGITGLKTGFTSKAGYCLSATAEKDGLSLCAVVLGGSAAKERNADVSAILDYGFANYVSFTPTPDRPLMPVKVRMGEKEFVPVELSNKGPVTLRRAASDKPEKTVTLEDALKAPVKKGQKVGEMTVTQGGKTVSRIDIVASSDVPRLGFGGIFKRLFRTATMR